MNTARTSLRLAHLSLGVADLDVSERFYGHVLGLPTQRVGDHIEVRWSDFLLILAPSPPAARAKFHFGFVVQTPEEVDAWAERLRKSGVEIVTGPTDNEGLRQLYCVDPDDYQLEIYCDASQ